MALDLPGDLPLTDDGDIELATGDDALAIRLQNRICTNEGEWAFNTRFGLPWLFQVLGERVDTSATRSLIVQALGEDQEVASVGTVSVEYDSAQRRAVISASVKSTSGQTVTV